MMPLRGLVLAALAAALAGVQARCLEPQPEIRAERVYTNIAQIPPGDAVPTYVASLFFGSFRALVIDFLWIQLKRVEEEKRWYERREILKLISYFQPRNREVWAMLGWHSAYNVANSFSDPERSWEWVRFGLEWLRRGIQQIPDSPYLKTELGWTLLHKPSWRDGWLDLPLLARIEGDRELQEILQDRRPIERARSAFELAIDWYAKAREELLRQKDQRITTQMGLNIYAQTADAMIRDAMYLQGIYDWKMNRPERAKEWFLKSADQARKILQEYDASPIFKDVERFCRGLPRVVDLEGKARNGRPEDERAFLEALQKLVIESSDIGVPDREFLWMEGNPEAPLNRLKQKLAGGRDPRECNDDFKLAGWIREGEDVRADLQPAWLDVDFYRILIPPPEGKSGEPAPERPPVPVLVILHLRRPEGSALDLRITVFSGTREKQAEGTFAASSEEGRLEFRAERYGPYFVKVEPAGDPRTWPADTRYALSWTAPR